MEENKGGLEMFQYKGQAHPRENLNFWPHIVWKRAHPAICFHLSCFICKLEMFPHHHDMSQFLDLQRPGVGHPQSERSSTMVQIDLWKVRTGKVLISFAAPSNQDI